MEVTWRSEAIVFSFDENCPQNKPISASAHAFLAFLGCLGFSMGNIKVARWNGLEILIPKHMWKSKIGLLEQIWAKNLYVTFFWGHPVYVSGSGKKRQMEKLYSMNVPEYVPARLVFLVQGGLLWTGKRAFPKRFQWNGISSGTQKICQYCLVKSSETKV